MTGCSQTEKEAMQGCLPPQARVRGSYLASRA